MLRESATFCDVVDQVGVGRKKSKGNPGGGEAANFRRIKTSVNRGVRKPKNCKWIELVKQCLEFKYVQGGTLQMIPADKESVQFDDNMSEVINNQVKSNFNRVDSPRQSVPLGNPTKRSSHWRSTKKPGRPESPLRE